jgi:hypothetical protein
LTSRRTMLAPIRPKPIIPSCMIHLPSYDSGDGAQARPSDMLVS